MIVAALYKLRHTADEAGEHRYDIIHFVHRQAGVIQAALDRLEVIQPSPARVVRRPAGVPSAAEAVFGKAKTPVREQRREIVGRKGGRVRVIERRSAGQMELGL